MAYRKKMLHHRIHGQAANHQAAMGEAVLVPMGDAHPAVPRPVEPMVTPLSRVLVQPIDGNYVTLGMEDLAPIFSADGAALPATGPGRWDQLALAGGGRHG